MKVKLILLTLFFCSISFAQTTITGKVVDNTNQPIPGANIKIVGESIGTTSDFDGNFTLTTQKNHPLPLKFLQLDSQPKEKKSGQTTKK